MKKSTFFRSWYDSNSFWNTQSLQKIFASLLLAVSSSSAFGQAPAIPIQFQNGTGRSGSQIFLQFLGGDLVTGTYTDPILGQQNLQSNTAYSLDQITDPTTGRPTINVQNFSGRVYVNFGPYGLNNMGGPGGLYTPAAPLTIDPNYNIRYQYFEPTIAQDSTSATTFYGDLSYIDFTSISLSMSARLSSNDKINTNASNPNQISQIAKTLIDATVNSAQNKNLVALPSYSPNLPNKQFTRVISPQFGATGAYHDFSAYLSALNGQTVRISGYFVGTGTQPTGVAATERQTYDFNATFNLGNANPADDNVTLTATNLSGNSQVILDGVLHGSLENPGVGNTNLTITVPINTYTSGGVTYNGLNSVEGIYGNNPAYTVSNDGTSTAYSSISNDVYGRIVGDLLAGLSLGYIGSTVEYNGTAIGTLNSTQWWAAGESQGTNPTYFPNGLSSSNTGYVKMTSVVWADTPASQGLYFDQVQSNPLYYNTYASSLSPLTTGYGFPLQDRLGDNLLSFTNGTGFPETYLRVNFNSDNASALPTGIWNSEAPTGQWTTASNWLGNTVPPADASVQFGNGYGKTITVDTVSDQSAAGIYFNYAAGTFTIANNTITLSGDIVNSSTNTQTINSALTLGSDSSVVAAFGDLVLGGNIALSNSSTPNTIQFAGNQDTTIGGIISDGPGTGGNLVKSGTGTLTLNGANTFSGGLDLENGTIVLGNASAAGSGPLTLGTPTSTNPVVLQTAGSAQALASDLTLAGDVNFTGSDSFTFSGETTIAGTPATSGPDQPGDYTVNNTVDVEFSGAITEAIAGSSLTKSGSGDMTFSGASANTLTGLLSVNKGTLNLNKSSTPAFGGDLAIGDGNGAANSAIVQLDAADQTPSSTVASTAPSISINTDGQLDLQSLDTTVNYVTMAGGTIGGSGTLTLLGTPAISSQSIPAQGGSLSFNGVGSASATVNADLILSNPGSASTNFDIGNSDAVREMSINGSISGDNMTKVGSGTLALLGTNTITGAVTIAGGILQTGSLSGAVVSVSGGAISTPNSNGNATITVEEFASVNGGLLLGLAATTADNINVTSTAPNAINLDASHLTTFFFENAGFTSGTQTFDLITGVNSNVWDSFSANALQFSSINIPGLTGSFSLVGNTLKFTATAGVSDTWLGTTSGAWATASNWQSNSVPLSGADLSFGVTTNPTISVGADRTTGSLTFETGAPAYTIGTVGDNFTITIGGNLTNSSTNTQTINSDVALNADRTFSADAGDLVFGGTVSLSSSPALAGTLTIDGANDTTFSGVIEDSATTGASMGGSIIKQGTGTLALTGTNTFTGPVTIQDGVVQANTPASLGSQLNTIIFAGGTLEATADMTFLSTRTLQMQSTGEIQVDANDTLTVEGAVVGAGGLTKTGPGTLSFPGAGPDFLNTYKGATLISNGSLEIAYPQALGATTSGTTVQNGGSLVINAVGAGMTISNESLSLSGAGAGSNGALHLSTGTLTWNGPITLAGDASIQADGSTILNLPGAISAGTNTLTFTGASDEMNFSGTLTGSGEIAKTGTGTVNISGSNQQFTGDTTISNGILSIQRQYSLGNGSTSLEVAAGGTLQIATQISTALQVGFGAITLNGNGYNNSGTNMGAINNDAVNGANISGPITLAGNTLIKSSAGQLTLSGTIDNGGNTLTVNTSAPVVLSGSISGAGGVSVTNGSLTLSGNNTYLGGTSVGNGSALTIANSNALGAITGGTNVTLGGALQIQGGINVGNESLTISGGGLGYGSLNNLSGINTYAGLVDATAGAIIQATKGKLTLTNSSGLKLSGAQIIIRGEGTLSLQNGISLESSSDSPNIAIQSGTLAASNASSSTSDPLRSVLLNLGPMTSLGGNPTFSPGDINNAATVYVSNLIAVSNSTGNAGLIMDLGQAGVAADSDQVIGMNAPSITATDSQPFVFFFNNNGFTTSATYPLITANNGAGIGGLSSPLSNLTFTSNIPELSGTFSLSSPVPSVLSFSASASAAVWDNSAGDGEWSTVDNWQIDENPITTLPADGSAVEFTAPTSTTVDTGKDRTVGGINFASGSTALTIANNTISTYGEISNSSTVVQTINSALTLVGNTGINAASGNLVLGGPINIGSYTLGFSGSNNTTINGVISGGLAGSSALTKTGSGNVTLTAANTFIGTATISGGTLINNGSTGTGATIVIDSGGTLAGSGSELGAVIIDGGTISPGNSPGTHTSGTHEWRPNGDLNWQIYDAESTAGTGYDVLSITGALDLSKLETEDFFINLWSLSDPQARDGSAINFDESMSYSWTLVSTNSGISGFQPGQFFVYTGSNNGTNGFENAFDGTFSVALSGKDLVLNYAPSDLLAQYWDGSQTVGNGAVNGGDGVWNNSLTNWTDEAGTTNDDWKGEHGVFSGSAGTVTVEEDVEFRKLSFRTDGYQIEPGGGTLQPVQLAEVRTDPNVTATISAEIGGAGGIKKTGDGELFLTGDNSYSGGTQLIQGTLRVGSDTALGTGQLKIYGGVFATNGFARSLTNELVIANDFSLDPNGDVLELHGSMDLGSAERIITLLNNGQTTFDGVISGTGGMNLQASSALPDARVLLTGSSGNTYSGLTTVGANVRLSLLKNIGLNAIAGELLVQSEGIVGLLADDQIADTSDVAIDGTLELTRITHEKINGLFGNGAVSFFSEEPGQLEVGSGNFSGTISDGPASLDLIKPGAGTLILGGANTYTGLTVANGGMLLAKNDTAFGTGIVISDNTGTVVGIDRGVTIANQFQPEDGGAILNRGIIDSGTVEAIQNFTNGATVENHGTIRSDILAIAANDGVFALKNLGTDSLIESESADAFRAQTSKVGIVNEGTIRAFGTALVLEQGGTIQNSGTISGGDAAITALGGNVNLTNSGQIDGDVLLAHTKNQVSLESGSQIDGELNLGNDSRSQINLVDHGRTSHAVTGNIFSNGALLKQGPGTWIVDSFIPTPGGTYILGGKLQIGDGGTLNGFVVNNSELSFKLETDFTFSGTIVGTGDVIQDGTSNTIFLGEQTYTGTTYVRSGGLILGDGEREGSLAGDVVVKEGAFFGGIGSIAGNFRNKGMLTPGFSPGSLAIKGKLTLDSTSILVIEIASARNYDTLTIGGRAKLGGTLRVVLLGDYEPVTGTAFEILKAKSLSGKFAKVVQPGGWMLDYLNNSFELIFDESLLPRPSYQSFAATNNQVEVAAALEELRRQDLGKDTDFNNNIRPILDTLPPAAFRRALDAITPAQAAAFSDSQFARSKTFLPQMDARLADIRAGSRGFVSSGFNERGAADMKEVFLPTPDNKWGVWVDGSGAFNEVANVSNLGRGQGSSAAGTVGADYRLSDNFTLGLYTGYVGSWTDFNNNSEVNSNGSRFGVYSTWQNNGLYLNAVVGGEFNSYDWKRRIQFPGLDRTATADTDGAAFETMFGGGYDWKICKSATAGLFSTIEYTYLSIDQFTETGAGALNLRINDQNADSLRTNLGAQIACEFPIGTRILRPSARVAWRHEYLDGSRGIGSGLNGGAGPGFNTNLPGSTRKDSLLLNIGGSMEITDQVTCYLYYTGDLAGSATENIHSINTGIRLVF